MESDLGYLYKKIEEFVLKSKLRKCCEKEWHTSECFHHLEVDVYIFPDSKHECIRHESTLFPDPCPLFGNHVWEGRLLKPTISSRDIYVCSCTGFVHDCSCSDHENTEQYELSFKTKQHIVCALSRMALKEKIKIPEFQGAGTEITRRSGGYSNGDSVGKRRARTKAIDEQLGIEISKRTRKSGGKRNTNLKITEKTRREIRAKIVLLFTNLTCKERIVQIDEEKQRYLDVQCNKFLLSKKDSETIFLHDINEFIQNIASVSFPDFSKISPDVMNHIVDRYAGSAFALWHDAKYVYFDDTPNENQHKKVFPNFEKCILAILLILKDRFFVKNTRLGLEEPLWDDDPVLNLFIPDESVLNTFSGMKIDYIARDFLTSLIRSYFERPETEEEFFEEYERVNDKLRTKLSESNLFVSL